MAIIINLSMVKITHQSYQLLIFAVNLKFNVKTSFFLAFLNLKQSETEKMHHQIRFNRHDCREVFITSILKLPVVVISLRAWLTSSHILFNKLNSYTWFAFKF